MRPAHALPAARTLDPDDLIAASVRIARCRDRLEPVRTRPCLEVLEPADVDARLAALTSEFEVLGMTRPERD